MTINESLGHTLSSSEQEMVTSLTSGGALVGAVGAGLTADRFGRRWRDRPQRSAAQAAGGDSCGASASRFEKLHAQALWQRQ